MWKGVKSKQCEPKICAANEWDFHIRSNTLVRSKKKMNDAVTLSISKNDEKWAKLYNIGWKKNPH